MRWVGLAVGVALACLAALPSAQALSFQEACDFPAGCLLGPSCEIVGVGGNPPQPMIDEKCIPIGPSPSDSPPEPSAPESSDTNSTTGGGEQS